MIAARKSALRFGLTLGAFIAAVSLAGCASEKDKMSNVGPCPPAHVLGDAGRLVEFNGEEAYSNVTFTGEVTQVRSTCRYVGADPIDMELEIDLSFGRGPAAKADARTYNYWVAVTRRDITVLAKKDYSLKVKFPAGAQRMGVTEKVGRIVIPRANSDTSGANFEILVGFDLTKDQLDFNREGKKFRIQVQD